MVQGPITLCHTHINFSLWRNDQTLETGFKCHIGFDWIVTLYVVCLGWAWSVEAAGVVGVGGGGGGWVEVILSAKTSDRAVT